MGHYTDEEYKLLTKRISQWFTEHAHERNTAYHPGTVSEQVSHSWFSKGQVIDIIAHFLDSLVVPMPVLTRLNNMFHVDWTRKALVKTSNNEPVPTDEPIFIIRARDSVAYDTICYYVERCRICSPSDRIKDLEEVADKFYQYRANHQDKIKIPGSTHGK